MNLVNMLECGRISGKSGMSSLSTTSSSFSRGHAQFRTVAVTQKLAKSSTLNRSSKLDIQAVRWIRDVAVDIERT